MRTVTDILIPSLKTNYRMGSDRAEIPINLEWILLASPPIADVSAALATIVASLASVKGNAAVIGTEDYTIVAAFATLCSDPIPRPSSTPYAPSRTALLVGSSERQSANCERWSVPSAIPLAVVQGFEQTLQALTKQAIAQSQTLRIRDRGTIQLTTASFVHKLFEQINGITSTRLKGIQQDYRDIAHDLSHLHPRDPTLVKLFKTANETWEDIHSYPGVAIPADICPSTLPLRSGPI